MSEDVRDRPRFCADDAVRTARELYGITASSRELPSERDQNFRLHAPSGERFVLKLSNPAVNRELLDCQNQAMQHLAQRCSAEICPRVCSTLSGEQITSIQGAGGVRYQVRMLSYLPGVPLAKVKPQTPELLRKVGRFLGKMSHSLARFSHPAASRQLNWDLQYAGSVVGRLKEHIADSNKRAIVERFLSQYETIVRPALPHLRRSVIHNDANDYNILLDNGRPDNPQVVRIIDFGDIVHSCTVFELAIPVAYTMLGKPDPVAAAAHVVGGYHEQFPLTEYELPLIFVLACMRLCTTVAMAAQQQKLDPENAYLRVSEQAAWEALSGLSTQSTELAHYVFRAACQLPPCAASAAVVDWLQSSPDCIGPVVAPELESSNVVVFDLSVGSIEFAQLPEAAGTAVFSDALFGRMKAANAEVGIGRYGEARRCYTSELFDPGRDGQGQWRTIHLGVDLFLEAGAPVFAPLDGTIQSFRDNRATLDYGPTIILEHEVDGGRIRFFTLYGHLSRESLDGLHPGKAVRKTERIGTIGTSRVNGNWPPHLHFQIISDLLGKEGDFPGVATAAQQDVWLSISPDPNIILGIPEECFPAPARNPADILKARQQHLGKALSVSYKEPLNIVRGSKQYLYDETGRVYLDAVNNVCHVGHCHRRVVEAAQKQIAVLNTNTRYLHDNIVRYAERLSATLPDPLNVCFFVCTGSEANDLALRLARSYTGHTDVIVVDGAYHGNLTSLVEISPYKFDGPGGSGAPAHVHTVAMPDGYRGMHKRTDPKAGEKYADGVRDAIQQARARGVSVAAFFSEPVLGCGGQIVLPRGYLKEAYRHVRDAGGVCVADEVQVGFGRVGSHFWAFETQGVVPDIVTLGKPIGNGHPIGAVVTTPEIADAFANGMEYFNTFGGNPVSCAVGMAVLDVIAEERLQENALRVGNRLKAGLEQLKGKYPVIGDVRGLGLFLGIELVLDRTTLEPAQEIASYIVERMKDNGILLSIDGPLHNVLKIKPPLVFSECNADTLVAVLGRVLAEDGAQPRLFSRGSIR